MFPFQGQLAKGKHRIEVEPASRIHEAQFQLKLDWGAPVEFARDIEPALWAWINFSGIGGRTRRGCGTIKGREVEVDQKGTAVRTIEDYAPTDAADLVAAWRQYMPTLYPNREWPTLAECLMLRTTDQPGDPIPVWDWLVGLFKHFRQGEDFARNSGHQTNRPGRSRFPEPETIRRVTGQRSGQHARLPQIPDDAFPRAELGLPIVFHFQGEGEPPKGRGEPLETTLYPSPGPDGQKRDRMASPLILKPLALQDGKAIPLILRLRTPDLMGVDLRLKETSLALPTTAAIRDPRLSSYPDSPLKDSPIGSALEAFLAFAATEGFTEVTQ